jgi:hypothetical protein
VEHRGDRLVVFLVLSGEVQQLPDFVEHFLSVVFGLEAVTSESSAVPVWSAR